MSLDGLSCSEKKEYKCTNQVAQPKYLLVLKAFHRFCGKMFIQCILIVSIRRSFPHIKKKSVKAALYMAPLSTSIIYLCMYMVFDE